MGRQPDSDGRILLESSMVCVCVCVTVVGGGVVGGDV